MVKLNCDEGTDHQPPQLKTSHNNRCNAFQTSDFSQLWGYGTGQGFWDTFQLIHVLSLMKGVESVSASIVSLQHSAVLEDITCWHWIIEGYDEYCRHKILLQILSQIRVPALGPESFWLSVVVHIERKT